MRNMCCYNLWCVTQVWLRLDMWRMVAGECLRSGTPRYQASALASSSPPNSSLAGFPSNTECRQKRATSFSNMLLKINLVCVVFVSFQGSGIRLDGKVFPSDNRTKSPKLSENLKPSLFMSFFFPVSDCVPTKIRPVRKFNFPSSGSIYVEYLNSQNIAFKHCSAI